MKSLVTGVAAVALVAAAAGGVTSIASSTSAAPAVAPVVFGIPMPAAPAPDLEGPLNATLAALGAAGPFSARLPYIEPLGGLTGRVAESQYNSLVKRGVFPLTATISNVDSDGTTATGLVTATSANGAPHSTTLTFVAGPSPTGWLLTKSSLSALSASVSA
jgi:hypothetical protein